MSIYISANPIYNVSLVFALHARVLYNITKECYISLVLQFSSNVELNVSKKSRDILIDSSSSLLPCIVFDSLKF